MNYSWEQIQSDPGLVLLKQAMEQGRLAYEYRGHPVGPHGHGGGYPNFGQPMYAHAQLAPTPAPVQAQPALHTTPLPPPTQAQTPTPTVHVPTQRTRMSTEPPETPGAISIPPAPSLTMSTMDTLAQMSIAQPALAPLMDLLVAQHVHIHALTEAIEKLASAQREQTVQIAAWKAQLGTGTGVKVEGEGEGDGRRSMGVQVGEEWDVGEETSIDSEQQVEEVNAGGVVI